MAKKAKDRKQDTSLSRQSSAAGSDGGVEDLPEIDNDIIQRSGASSQQGGSMGGSLGSGSQQSALREGMGHHRPATREEVEALEEATRDVDDLGSHHSATSREREDK